jgi:Na+-transporting methylmalonyl-CoA/oxaloacetate decarboxylase gamma subunit
MNPDMIIGLRIFLIGFSVTFLALALLSFVMKFLPRIFPVKASQTEQVPTNQTNQDGQLEEMAVALAVGLCLLEKHHALEYQDPTLGNLLKN